MARKCTMCGGLDLGHLGGNQGIIYKYVRDKCFVILNKMLCVSCDSVP